MLRSETFKKTLKSMGKSPFSIYTFENHPLTHWLKYHDKRKPKPNRKQAVNHK
jgi:hypothetical protein